MAAQSQIEPLIKASEAAELLGIHEKTLKKWASQGIVPAWRNGPAGHWYFRASSLDEWAKSQLNCGRRSIPPRRQQ